MQIDRESVISLLQGQGHFEQAQQAFTALPQTIDLTDHGPLLEQLGIDPGALGEQLSNAGETIGNLTERFSQEGEGGLGGIIEKIKGFLGQ